MPTTVLQHSRLLAMAGPAAVAVAGCTGCALVLWGDPTTPGGPLPVCPTKALLGITCPGCGSMRMVYSLLHGDLGAAVHFNAVALVALPLLAGAWVAWALARWRGRPLRCWQQRYDLRKSRAPLVAGIVLAVWLVVRNIPVEPFTSLRV